MPQYDAIAHIYDLLNAELDYAAWAEFAEAAFDRFLPARPELVLDLACGTGSMTHAMAARGYDMIGVDRSPEMLSTALSRTDFDREGPSPLFLCQDMRSFELYGTVGAVLCCLDSINYLTDEGDLDRCFATVHNYLDPDGIFLFDVNTPYKFSHTYADNAYILETETEDGAVFCGWQNAYDSESGVCDFYLTLFEENEDGSYSRAEEHQRERCYSHEALLDALSRTGFAYLGTFADYQFGEPGETTERWYIAARACKGQI